MHTIIITVHWKYVPQLREIIHGGFEGVLSDGSVIRSRPPTPEEKEEEGRYTWGYKAGQPNGHVVLCAMDVSMPYNPSLAFDAHLQRMNDVIVFHPLIRPVLFQHMRGLSQGVCSLTMGIRQLKK